MRNRVRRTIRQAIPAMLAIAGISLGSATVGSAQDLPQARLTPADQGWIARIQDALTATTLFKARFQQIAPDGKRSTGTAWLDRPGRMRFDYDKPSPLLLVANDGQIVYVDRDLGQVTTLPVDRTPVGLLLRPDLKLSGDVTVTALRHVGGRVNLTMVRSAAPAEGSLTLMFDEQPLTLRGWVVRDAQGRDTQVDLFDITTPGSLPASLFVLPKDAG
ncbi:LolA family protein [Acidomonas methanolica]|uniref:LolA family protein n=1 Tax=Acidomonas methanolica TaxID=437 RepID=UPI00351D22F4